MFIGHFGIAELGKASRRDLPLLWLAVAAYLPDLTRILIAVENSSRKVSNFGRHPRQSRGGNAIMNNARLTRCEGEHAAAGIVAETHIADIAPDLQQIAIM